MTDFQNEVFSWFLQNKRDLPWRDTNDPYKIWISEIILQQTRVKQGTTYFQRFIECFPNVKKLAEASEDEVLKLWQGLGYYSRARNLHYSAKLIVNEYGSVFPKRYEEIIKLKGIGQYTAAAIASIAFDLPYPTVDGNIYRVLARYFGIETPIDSTQGKKEFYALAEELLYQKDPGTYNQALMEFGALQCVPKSPKCNNCPLVQSCYAQNNNSIESLPVKSKKTKQIKRFLYYYYIDQQEFTFLEKRTQKDIWQNLFQFPLYESRKLLSEKEIIQIQLSFIKDTVNVKSISSEKKHILSHQIIHARLIHLEINQSDIISGEFLRINKKDISKFAVPRLLEQFIEELNIE